MKRIISILLVLLSISFLTVGCNTNDNTVKNGEEFDIRVIAGTVSAAEYLDLLEVPLVGVVSTERGLPQRYQDLPQIGLPMSPDLEKIVSLSPDLYITEGSLKERIETLLDGHDIDIFLLSGSSYDGVKENIRKLSEMFNRKEKGEKLLKEMEKREEKVLSSTKGKEAPKVLVIFGTPESFMLATKNSFIGSLIEKIGAVNVVDGLNISTPAPYVPFSLETVADINPDIILRLTHASPDVMKGVYEKEFSQGFWVNLNAVKNDKVFDLDTRYFGVTGNVRAIDALEKLAELLYK